MSHISPVMYHLSPVTCLSLHTFQAVLVMTLFMLKPLEARRKKTFATKLQGNETHQLTKRHMDIATYRLRRHRGRFCEKGGTQGQFCQEVE